MQSEYVTERGANSEKLQEAKEESVASRLDLAIECFDVVGEEEKVATLPEPLPNPDKKVATLPEPLPLPDPDEKVATLPEPLPDPEDKEGNG